MQNKSIDFSSGNAGTMHYHQWMPEQPVAWLHIMHGMAEHSARYADLAACLNRHGIMVTAGDHRGHGMTGSSADSLYHFADHNGWNQMVDDQWQLVSHIAKQQQLPLIILGHSMGSFMATHFCQRYGQQLQQEFNQSLAGLVLSGSNYTPPTACKIIAGVAWVERARVGGRNVSNILEQLSFGAFNRAFAPVRTEKDWLSKDHETVDRYIEDPWCGGAISTQSWLDFIQGLADIFDSKALSKIDNKLPVFLFSGSLDPVGGQGKGVIKLQQALLGAGVEQVDIKLYKEGRHEMLNETNREEVYQDLLNWIQTLQ